jgi:very-short-patch-repair endonuclease
MKPTHLEKRGVLFFASARCRIRNRLKQTETKEADFLVFYQGKTRILEVDGREYHQDRDTDYKRDRIFDQEGLVTTRFSASECLHNPD